MRAKVAAMSALLWAGIGSGHAQAPASDEGPFRALYKELVETNTTLSSGSCTLAAERMDRWEAAAAALHEEGYCSSVASEKVAQTLRYLYESRPALSLRAIGAKPEVGLRHDTVGKIRDAAAAVLGVAAGHE